MPEVITNPDIIAHIDMQRTTRDALLKESEEYSTKINNLNKEAYTFIELMDKEYGVGGWQNVNADNYTFLTRDEFMKDYNIIKNPNLTPKVRVDDIDLQTNDLTENNNGEGIQGSTEENSIKGEGESESGGSDTGISNTESESSSQESQSETSQSQDA